MKNLVGADTYLMKLIRYVALNPGRARMVDHPEKWSWSSYNAMVGKFQRRPPALPLEKIAQAHANRNKAIVAIYATGEYSYLESTQKQ